MVAISERLGYNANDNKLDYWVGPCRVSVCPWDEIITLSIENPKFKDLLEEVEEAAIRAWKINKSHIVKENMKVVIPLDYKILKLYVAYVLILA